MISLSSTLKKNYIKLIILFTILLIVSLAVTGKYLINTSKLHLRNAMSFLTYEIGDEPSSNTLKIFTDNLVNNDFKVENPILNDLKVVIKYKDYIYSENENKEILDIAKDNKVENFNFYEYLILSNNIKNKDGEIYKVMLIKDLKPEKKFFFNIVKIFMGGLILCIIISAIIVEHLLKKISKQLITLENINSNITLENLEILKPVNQFKEFDNIWGSYERMLKRLDEQNKKQIEFVHNASHELKTPIFIIGGYIDMIKRWGQNDPDILNEALNSIGEETKAMATLIEKLLFIAKEGDIKSEKSEIELSEIIVNTISSLRILYPKSTINFEPNYTIIKSDEGLVKLLIRNILENAIKYGDNKPIDITLNCNNIKNRTTLCIQDHGIGMSSEELIHIYDRFYRVNKSRSKEISGHGLGMTIVKRILNLIDADITIDSQLNIGTSVTIFFQN
ncbi:HAMP domain-containing histidine kinase [Cetobacterium sp. 8H]|uniref:sensor histidine kinase n=1 Tax=Cetobacterium sp. 8H TaxID=2759681 RepID=UPI00163C673F|nr:HAMP domain-containing sensor histidine kinase [Cetobacterium sp. 8H]MBC2850848.1 HAMP domain-containing histidine kinase [Cetobacterium sp. 8H]